MSKSKTVVPQKILDHNADMVNRNKGTAGTNVTYDKAQGHHGFQLNPEKPKRQG